MLTFPPFLQGKENLSWRNAQRHGGGGGGGGRFRRGNGNQSHTVRGGAAGDGQRRPGSEQSPGQGAEAGQETGPQLVLQPAGLLSTRTRTWERFWVSFQEGEATGSWFWTWTGSDPILPVGSIGPVPSGSDVYFMTPEIINLTDGLCRSGRTLRPASV